MEEKRLLGKVIPEFDGTRSDQRKHPLAWAWNGMETGAMGECKRGAKTQQWQDRMKGRGRKVHLAVTEFMWGNNAANSV